MDPELAAALTQLPAIDFADLPAARSLLDQLAKSVTSTANERGLAVSRHMVGGHGSDPAVPLLMFRPAGATGALPVLLWMHSGGFALGSAELEIPFCERVADELQISVAAVDYRLAPETPFPGPLDDCYSSLAYLHRRADSLFIDPARIAVGGSSAGGGLAAGTALMARDLGEVAIVFQALECPELDDRLGTRSMEQLEGAPVWSPQDAGLSWRRYLGDAYRGPDDREVSPYAAPARATDLTGLPPAYISTMELDPLRDEGIHYALQLLHAGVGVELHSLPGTFHRSNVLQDAGVSRRARAELIDAIGRGLRPGTPGK